jgi:FkbM family methyltransferase
MPKISLAVCLRGERDFLARLLENTRGCYDDLVVVHDGPEELKNNQSKREVGENKEKGWNSPEELSLAAPDAPPKAIARDYAQLAPGSPLPTGYRLVGGPTVPGSVHELVDGYGGRFYEGPRCFQQEPHWPFAWWAVEHDWILRLDADERPTKELSDWLACFRTKETSGFQSTGFSCIWPLWDGRKRTTNSWPTGRLFLFNRQHASMIGMAEETPLMNGTVLQLPLVLCHEPRRKSYGLRNILARRQAYAWRKVIATSLMQSPQSLPRWKCVATTWTGSWRSIKDEPLVEGIYRLFKFPLEQARALRAHSLKISPSVCLNPALHNFLICMKLWQLSGFPQPRLPLRRLARKVLLGLTMVAISSRVGKLQKLGGICPWTLDPSLVNGASHVVSGGVGGDISFELELARQTGCEVALFDPSPTGRATIASLKPLPRNIKFHEKALAGGSGKRKFAAPVDVDEGSFREPDSESQGEFEWPSVAVEDFMRENAWDKLDLLKLDIEGFEFEVLDALLRSELRPRQILVEFHYGREMQHSFWNYLWLLIRLKKAGYVLVYRYKLDHSFVRLTESLPP